MRAENILTQGLQYVVGNRSYYMKPPTRADLQISLGKQSVSLLRIHLADRAFITPHVASKDHVTTWPVWSAYKAQLLIEFGKKDLKKGLQNL